MRALLLVFVASCTPQIVPGAYLCGPDSSCPEGLVCDGPSNLCVLPAQAQPFECDQGLPTQQDLAEQDCVSIPFERQGCIVEGDDAHWVTFVPRAVCSAVEVEARLTFPFAFGALGLELWDAETNTRVATDGDCTQGAEIGQDRRCIDHVVEPGKQYRVEVRLTGESNCDGACAYNRYMLRLHLATPG